MSWDLTADRPIYSQLVEQIEMRIIAGVYRPGEKLPSVRELAASAGVNPNTMQRALSEMEEKGLVFTQRTSGRFITENISLIEKAKNAIAKEEIAQFLDKLNKLGFDREDAMLMISNFSLQEAPDDASSDNETVAEDAEETIADSEIAPFMPSEDVFVAVAANVEADNVEADNIEADNVEEAERCFQETAEAAKDALDEDSLATEPEAKPGQ